MNKTSRNIGVILFFISICIALLNRYTNENKINKLKNNADTKILAGKIKQCEKGWRTSAFDVYYEYESNGSVFKNQQHYRYTYTSKLKDSLCNKNFPVLVSLSNSNNSYLLLLPDDFKRFNMPFPDSLTWVLKYFD